MSEFEFNDAVLDLYLEHLEEPVVNLRYRIKEILDEYHNIDENTINAFKVLLS
jgi:hypothetical protein